VAAASAVTASADIAVATTTSTTDPSSRSASPFGDRMNANGTRNAGSE
jgi:hypothetical protein